MTKKMFLAVCAAVAICSCGPSLKLSQSWVPANSTPHHFNKIVVLVLAPAKYSDAGHIGEQDLAAELKANGVNAVSAQDEFGPTRFRKDDEQGALAALKRTGADGVIVTSLLDEQKDKRWVPGAGWYPPMYYGRFWGYYSFWYDRAYDQGYYETTRKYFLETNLYDLSTSNRDLIYSIQSQTMDPQSADALAKTFSKRVVKDMKAKHVI